MAKRIVAPCSEGQRQLVALRLSQRDIGAAVAVSHATVQRWLSGVTAPMHPHQLKLAEIFGIPLASWTQSPMPAEPETVAGYVAARLQAAADATAGVQASATAMPDNAAGLEALIEQCRKARAVEDIAPTVLARIGALEVSATAARERLRTALEIALQSDAWHELMDHLIERLCMHPLAKIDVVRRELEASSTPARNAEWDAAHQAWRARWADRVKAAEEADAALLEVLPPHCRFEDVRPEYVHAVPPAVAA